METITIKPTITIELDGKVLVDEEEYAELKRLAIQGQYGDIDWLKDVTGWKSTNTLKQKILDKYEDELKEFVFYPPANSRVSYRFLKSRMSEWLERNFERVVNERG